MTQLPKNPKRTPTYSENGQQTSSAETRPRQIGHPTLPRFRGDPRRGPLPSKGRQPLSHRIDPYKRTPGHADTITPREHFTLNLFILFIIFTCGVNMVIERQI